MYIQETGTLSRKDFLSKISILNGKNLIKDKKKILYYNIPVAFDIEVSSFYDGPQETDNKRAIMYMWQFGIYNSVIIGRTWDEFILLLEAVKEVLNLDDEKRIVVYVHNLPYEFQFIRKRIKWEKVFMLDDRKPVYAVTNGIEFKCSLKLSGGKSLEKIGNDLVKYKVKKAVGYLDYDLIRTPLTPLSDDELLYGENDIRVLLSYIQEKIEQDGDITKIPLTNTGYVRNFCRKECYKRFKEYRLVMNELTIETDEYKQLRRAFQGGFVHANANYVNRTIDDVASYDFTSSYPAVMVLEKFPMGKGISVNRPLSDDDLKQLMNKYCCLFDIEFFELMPKLFQDHPLSRYKCWVCENAITDNGRIVMAQHVGTTITEQDFFIYSRFYTWERIEIKNMRIYFKNYLPTRFVKAVLDLYEKKTMLKDVEEEKINYMISKNMLNACYGMMVTDPIRDEISYVDDTYVKKQMEIDSGISRYNSNIKRFLFYPWGVWVTAYARSNLFSGIVSIGEDYIYSDTDSLKIVNYDKHVDYIDSYNRSIVTKIEAASKFHNISKDRFSPKTKDGDVKTIGFWDFEKAYTKFKTLGAKRYLTLFQSTKPKYEVTLAGSNKVKTCEYLQSIGDPFKNFKDGLKVPKESSGRLILTYIDDETEGDVIDYTGVPYHYHELSSIHMEKSEYNLSMSEDFIRYLQGIEQYSE